MRAAGLVQALQSRRDEIAEEAAQLAKLVSDGFVASWFHPIRRVDRPVGRTDGEEDVVGDRADRVCDPALYEIHLARACWTDAAAPGDRAASPDDDEDVVTGMRMRHETVTRRQTDHVGSKSAVRAERGAGRASADQTRRTRGEVHGEELFAGIGQPEVFGPAVYLELALTAPMLHHAIATARKSSVMKTRDAVSADSSTITFRSESSFTLVR